MPGFTLSRSLISRFRPFDQMKMPNIASIDIGSHTARLLVGKMMEGAEMFRPLLRKRITIRLAEGIGSAENQIIKPEAGDRTLKACQEFAALAKAYDAGTVLAVSTGVTRHAANVADLFALIHERTGIRVKVLSGAEEARLTGKGVLHSLGVPAGPFMIFDLGGGSIEFLEGDPEKTKAVSLPLGAAVLTKRFFTTDPPGEKAIEYLARYIDETLRRSFGSGGYEVCDAAFFTGTGGTVTTLAAMVHRVGLEKIRPERLDGLKLEKGEVGALFEKMKNMTVAQRQDLDGVDRGRAEVILAGAAVVIRLFDFFSAQVLTVSLSDLLEGLLVEHLERSTPVNMPG